MNLANATVAQLLIPVSDFDKGVSFYRLTVHGPAPCRPRHLVRR